MRMRRLYNCRHIPTTEAAIKIARKILFEISGQVQAQYPAIDVITHITDAK